MLRIKSLARREHDVRSSVHVLIDQAYMDHRPKVVVTVALYYIEGLKEDDNIVTAQNDARNFKRIEMNNTNFPSFSSISLWLENKQTSTPN